MKKTVFAVALAATSFLSQPAFAATTIVPAGGSGTLIFTTGNSTLEIGNAFVAPVASFSNTFQFVLDQAAILVSGGVNTQQVRLRSTVLSDLDLTSAQLGGFALSGPNGSDNSENLSLSNALTNRVFNPGTYTVSVNGDVDTASVVNPARYTGSFSFTAAPTPTAAVPEPATWAMMLFGFGAIGFGMRRRNAAAPRVNYSFA